MTMLRHIRLINKTWLAHSAWSCAGRRLLHSYVDGDLSNFVWISNHARLPMLTCRLWKLIEFVCDGSDQAHSL
jgi:hypothetical protein